ncbi:MAG TPA: hypothetical protein VI457_06045 [Methylococcaceae bacterium]|nr:hypothetical protein [Methylococcaceae bacterium]
MEISSSSIVSSAFQANSARKDVSARSETTRQQQAPNGPSPLPAAEQRETLSRLALAGRSASERLGSDLPRSSRQALDAYADLQSSLEREDLQAAFQLAGIDQYV